MGQLHEPTITVTIDHKSRKEEDMKIKYTAPKVVASSSVHPC